MSLVCNGLILEGSNNTEVWGMTNTERMRRLFVKQDVENQLPVDSAIWTHLDFAFDPQWLVHVVQHPNVVVTVNGRPALAHLTHADQAIVLNAGHVPDRFTVINASRNPELYNHALRKLESPFMARLTPASVREIERQSYFGAYKGVTDVLTKYLWPELALVLTRGAARIGMSPNQVTSVGAILCVLATILFWQGSFWIGMLAGFGFMVLDTVDGKLARCTITSSWWGNVFDHGIDLIHPPFWWAAWGVGLGSVGLGLTTPVLLWTMAAIVGGYVAQRCIEGIFIARNSGLHIHVWEKLDSQFRLITARRNPNMVILFVATLAGRPDLGLFAVAGWTLLSCLFHLVRLVQAEWTRTGGTRIVSWIESRNAVPNATSIGMLS